MPDLVSGELGIPGIIQVVNNPDRARGWTLVAIFTEIQSDSYYSPEAQKNVTRQTTAMRYVMRCSEEESIEKLAAERDAAFRAKEWAENRLRGSEIQRTKADLADTRRERTKLKKDNKKLSTDLKKVKRELGKVRKALGEIKYKELLND